MGGPQSLDDIPEFLYNIFSDRSIIRLPGGVLFQKPFARLISNLRSKKVKENYRRIGGGSPLLKWTEAQARQLESQLGRDYPELRCFIAMRYFRPFTREAINSAYEQGFREFVFLPLYPQFSKATAGSSFREAELQLKKYSDVTVEVVRDFHDNAAYIELLRSYIDENIEANDILLFSAHSLPQKFVDEGDPYLDQIKQTAKLAAGEREYHLSFQSRTGPVKWVGPDTIEVVEHLLDSTEKNIFIVPISFICDHIETLFEIDIDLPERVGHKDRLRRMPMFNDDSRFTSVLAGIVSDTLEES
jgi:ferrochelatase